MLSACRISAPYDRFCPTRHATLPRMRRHFDDFQKRMEPELIATFGDAQIVKHLNGKVEVRGGTERDRTDAHAWMKEFNVQSTPLTLRRVR